MKQGPKMSPNYMYAKQNLGIISMEKITLKYIIIKRMNISDSSHRGTTMLHTEEHGQEWQHTSIDFLLKTRHEEQWGIFSTKLNKSYQCVILFLQNVFKNENRLLFQTNVVNQRQGRLEKKISSLHGFSGEFYLGRSRANFTFILRDHWRKRILRSDKNTFPMKIKTWMNT